MNRTMQFVCLIPTLCFGGMVGDVEKLQMEAELNTIRTTFTTMYAPREWKESLFGLDIDTGIDRIIETMYTSSYWTIGDYQKRVRSFFYDLNDFHAGVYFIKTAEASLPFTVTHADERFFLANVELQKLGGALFHDGDEIIEFDNLPIKEAISRNMAESPQGFNPSTDIALAARFLTKRSAVFGQSIPDQPVMIGLRHRNEQKIRNYQLMWEVNEEQLSYPLQVEAMPKLEMIAPQASSYLGDKVSYLPPLGSVQRKIINEIFHAYIFEDASGRQIGYIRIPNYQGGEAEALTFMEIIRKFESETDALVIDQLHNPGGSVLYLYSLASMLSDQPLKTPRHRISLNPQMASEAYYSAQVFDTIQSDQDAVELLRDTVDGYPVDFQFVNFLKNWHRFILRQWKAGKTLSDPTYLLGVDAINPNPKGHYTKPLLVLVDELCFSGGDFFPAILQDNKRAKIMGAKTAGAGGYVSGVFLNSQFGISHFTYTGSIAERTNKMPIENLGVTPDIPYTMTAEDVQNKFNPFRKAIMEQLRIMLSDEPQ